MDFPCPEFIYLCFAHLLCQLSSNLKESGASHRSAEQHNCCKDDCCGGNPEGQRQQSGQVKGGCLSLLRTHTSLLNHTHSPALSTLATMSCLQNTTDAIGRAAAEALQGPIQAAYKDAFQSVVLPVFERGCQTMFQQINDSFKQGTQECKQLCQISYMTDYTLLRS